MNPINDSPLFKIGHTKRKAFPVPFLTTKRTYWKLKFAPIKAKMTLASRST
jgi:hypothetical protein